MDVLIRGVEQEDERNDGVGGVRVVSLGEESRANSLKNEEDKHAGHRGQEEDTTTNSVDQERSTKSPEQIPNLEDTIDEELDGGIGDTDSVEDAVEVVGNETVTRPLREEGEGEDDPETLQVASLGEDGLPANVGSNGAIELNSSLDFLKFILDEGVFTKWRSNWYTSHQVNQYHTHVLPSA